MLRERFCRAMVYAYLEEMIEKHAPLAKFDHGERNFLIKFLRQMQDDIRDWQYEAPKHRRRYYWMQERGAKRI